jgi:hypothetical protein
MEAKIVSNDMVVLFHLYQIHNRQQALVVLLSVALED